MWDKRGALPVHELNAILQELQQWAMPSVMLVGNHDQASILSLAITQHCPITLSCLL